MGETKPMNADIAKALKALKPLSEKKDLPTHYHHKLALLMRGLDILGTELGKREAGAAKAMTVAQEEASAAAAPAAIDTLPPLVAPVTQKAPQTLEIWGGMAGGKDEHGNQGA